MLKRAYEHAGKLAEEHALRGFDAIHMASFLELMAQTDNGAVEFSAFDGRLVAAARKNSGSRSGT